MEKVDQPPPFKIKVAISSNKETGAPDDYTFDIIIINDSSVGFRSAEVAVKDNDSNRVATAIFGRIPSNDRDTKQVQLPGGIEFCIWKIVPDVGATITGFGAASNAPGVELTIND